MNLRDHLDRIKDALNKVTLDAGDVMFPGPSLPPPPPPPSLSGLAQQADAAMQSLSFFRAGGMLNAASLNTGFQVASITTLEKATVAGPLVGWRVWCVREDGTLLSLHHDCVWPNGRPLHQNSYQRVQQFPSFLSSVSVMGYGSGEGIYAMKARDDLNTQEVKADQVIGTVALWGRVIEHEKGYRAEYAYPLKIVMQHAKPPMPGFPRPARDLKIAERIRERYGCEVIA